MNIDKQRIILVSAFLLSAHICAAGVPFNSGSNGSYGPLNIAADTTLDMPPDGIFQCTTVSVEEGATLRFKKNALNTPVYLLATGDVRISGAIDVSGGQGKQALAGDGGPGGFDGGAPGNPPTPPGDGHGPGGGSGGRFSPSAPDGADGGAYAADGSFSDAATYGNSLLVPMLGGSGGGGQTPGGDGPGIGGGGGGGGILIASNTRIDVTGSIASRGGGTDIQREGYSNVGGGSGGGIRAIAPVVAGAGRLDVGTPIVFGYNFGGVGRIRIDTLDRSGWNFQFAGRVAYGKEMYVFPPVVPRLDITEAAGQAIPVGTGQLVQVKLARDASTNQVVKIQAKDFTGKVLVQVVIVPESGPKVIYPAEIDMSAGNPTTISVNVVIPTDVVNRVYAWTR